MFLADPQARKPDAPTCVAHRTPMPELFGVPSRDCWGELSGLDESPQGVWEGWGVFLLFLGALCSWIGPTVSKFGGSLSTTIASRGALEPKAQEIGELVLQGPGRGAFL